MIQPSTPALPNVPKRLPKMIISLYYLKYSQMSHDELMAECECFSRNLQSSGKKPNTWHNPTVSIFVVVWAPQRLDNSITLWFSVPHSSSIVAEKQYSTAETHSRCCCFEVGKRKSAFSQTAVHCSSFRRPLLLRTWRNRTSHQPKASSPWSVTWWDGFLSCCGEGLLDIKCPYSKCDWPTDIVDPSFYLKNTDNGLKLSHTHKYYFQVQGQMAIMWAGLHMESILNEFFKTMSISIVLSQSSML